MDLKNLLSDNQKTGNTQQESAKTPSFTKRPSSINLLVNNDDDDEHNITNADTSYQNSSSPVVQPMASPVLNPKLQTTVTHRTPSGRLVHTIRERNSISSLTNETDVGIDGKETPSVTRRLSYDTSENNSPVIPKKHIAKKTSANDLVSEVPSSKEEELVNEGEAIKQFPGDDKTQSTDQELPKGTETSKDKKTVKSKPKRYSKPPIWASKWRNSKQRDFSNGGGAGGSGAIHEPINGGSRSINDVKPYNDLTRRISNWLYSHIDIIPPEQRRFLELEIRFGQIWDKRNDRRIHLPVVNECILDKDFVTNECVFKSGLEASSFNQISKTLTDLVKRNPKNFKTMIIDQVDKQFREASRGEIPKRFRISYDRKTNRVMENIEKRKIDSLFVHTGDLKFDYRLSISLELVSNENPARFENKTPEVERYKNRTSIIHDKTSTRFDLTKVKQFSKVRNSNQTDDVEQLEAELEIDMPKLLHAFDNLDKDSFTFEDMSETLLDNARVLNRKLD